MWAGLAKALLFTLDKDVLKSAKKPDAIAARALRTLVQIACATPRRRAASPLRRVARQLFAHAAQLLDEAWVSAAPEDGIASDYRRVVRELCGVPEYAARCSAGDLQELLDCQLRVLEVQMAALEGGSHQPLLLTHLQVRPEDLE